MNRKIISIFVLISIVFYGCKKGYVLESASIKQTSAVANTDEIISYELLTDAYYKGKKIEPSAVTWTVIDANTRVKYQTIVSDTRKMTWKPSLPGNYKIKAEFEFDTKTNDRSYNEFITDVAASFTFLKNKVNGNYGNDDNLNPSYNFDFTINPDFTINGSINSDLHKQIFYLAQNNFTGCKINFVDADVNGKLRGTITVRDSATGVLRTDLLREFDFSNNYLAISFKQLYANDTNQYKYFELNKK